MDDSQKAKAVEFIKKHKKELIEKYASLGKYPSSDNPIAFFMAGSPGVGKTEYSTSFIKLIEKYKHSIKIVRIDADEIRKFIPIYDGTNSEIVQGAASLGVQKLFDHVKSKRQHFMLDGTFARYDLARQNIKSCLKRNRKVGIFYLYQDPLVAWKFTKIREKKEGRPVPKEVFINAFFDSKENVNKIKSEFKDKVKLYLIVKNYENQVEKTKFDIDKIDSFLKNKYTPEKLERMLKNDI